MKTSRFSPKIVGSAKGGHLTRLCHRIVCQECGQSDYIAKKLSDKNRKLCRKCAESLLNTYESGRFIKKAQSLKTCNTCGKEFFIPTANLLKDKEWDCFDCFRGFNVWRGKTKSVTGGEKTKTIIRSRHKNTILRKDVS